MARRKRKPRKTTITLPGGDAIASKPQGRDRRHVNQPAPRDEAHLPAMEVRKRQAGLRGMDALREAMQPWYGCEAGRAMASVTDPQERPALWDAIQRARRVQAAYDKVLGAPSRHPVCLRLLTPTDRLTTDADAPPIDLRDEDTRYRQAIAGWARLQGALGWCDKRDASVFVRSVIDDAECLDAEALVRAARVVAEHQP